ncbi:MAG: hypothetical protein GY898_13510 [Proteobacteria bacterium]|nr:hypothetical protein [Pseudomonadota bacterium]
MSRLSALLLALALLVPAAAMAGKKPMKRKALQLDPLGEEVAARGEYTDDLYKVVRKADRCLATDTTWQREQERPGDAAIHPSSLYEMLASSVVCWQEAEKKALAAGEIFAPSAAWISARARYMEAYRQFVWAIVAKLDGNQTTTCKRLVESVAMTNTARDAATGLADRFTVASAQALGAQADSEAQALTGMILGEAEAQKCN